MKSTDQLVSVIKYLRKEKDIAYGKFEVIRTENLRLKTQLENAEKQLRTAQESLKAEAEVTDTAVATSAKHAELLRKGSASLGFPFESNSSRVFLQAP
ncbi:unnamed protein product [Timema podura]|uniref:Uncharacterized protein n=1 Tax=Timema podura TaxID=61482 RepID=A0ABN7PI33_TIMPD|nr:unnamed protein product [Timema podura]